MKRGYLALYRKIQDHTFYKEPRVFSKYEAWIDILMEVRHKVEPGEVVIGMSVYLCNYGESLKSIKTWSKRWKWTESKVRRYFILLDKMNQIRTKSEGKTTRLSVINYSSYDPKRRDTDETPTKTRRDADEDATTDKNVKKDKNEKKPKEQIEYPSWLNQELFNGFLEDRKERKITATPRAVKGLITVLEKCCNGNYDLQEILIEKSITNSWKTFYPLKSEDMPAPKYKDPFKSECDAVGPPGEILHDVVAQVKREADERRAKENGLY